MQSIDIYFFVGQYVTSCSLFFKEEFTCFVARTYKYGYIYITLMGCFAYEFRKGGTLLSYFVCVALLLLLMLFPTGSARIQISQL